VDTSTKTEGTGAGVDQHVDVQIQEQDSFGSLEQEQILTSTYRREAACRQRMPRQENIRGLNPHYTPKFHTTPRRHSNLSKKCTIVLNLAV
jgi:hypothetical protein